MGSAYPSPLYMNGNDAITYPKMAQSLILLAKQEKILEMHGQMMVMLDLPMLTAVLGGLKTTP